MSWSLLVTSGVIVICRASQWLLKALHTENLIPEKCGSDISHLASRNLASLNFEREELWTGASSSIFVTCV